MELVKHHKRFGRDLPIYNLPKPPLPNGGRSCIIYGLLIGNDRDPESCYHRYIINSAFWAAHSWRVNSDLIKKQWDIYFFVERRLYEQPVVRSQFEAANVIDSVILFDTPQCKATKRKTGLRLYATVCREFDIYERAYLIDADMFLCRRENASIFEMDRIFNIGEDESLPNLYSANPVSHFRLQRPPYHLPKITAEARLKQHLENYLGTPLKKGFKCLSGIIAWNPQQLREDFKDMVRKLTPTVCNEENQYAIYLVKTNSAIKPLDQVWLYPENAIPRFGNFYGNFMKPDTPDHFFEHVVIGSDEPNFDRAAWIEKWYSHIGIHRRL